MDSMIEAMASAMYVWNHSPNWECAPPPLKDMYRGFAQQCVAAIEAKGYAVAPKVPTDTMIIAAASAEYPAEMWNYMLAAAPKVGQS